MELMVIINFLDECYRMEPLIKGKIEESERYSSCSQMHF